ncbi:MAG: S8 family serine peptidase [Phycisphaerales bacterium]|nr:S8 family serine peptidase [Phycisphaerales bacterium]
MGQKMSWSGARLLCVGMLLPLAGGFSLAADGIEQHVSADSLEGTRFVVPDSAATVRLWESRDALGAPLTHYAISLDGQRVAVERPVSPVVRMKYASFDPLAGEPEVPASLRAGSGNRLFLVQFHTILIDAYRAPLAEAGADLLKFVADQAFIVEMDESARQQVESLSFVRWVGALHPAYKLDPTLIDEIAPRGYAEAGAEDGVEAEDDAAVLGFNPVRRGEEAVEYSIMMTRRGPVPQDSVADRIAAMGGEVTLKVAEGQRIEARLTPAQVREVLGMNEVLFVDVPGEKSHDMDIARQIGGGIFIRDTLGFTGQGVRCEVMDDGQRSSHVDFQDPPTLWHGSQVSGSHGTSTSGIVYGSGTGQSQGTGMLPDAEAKIMAYWTASPNRIVHTQRLVDPNGPYRAVFQSNSWGNTQTTQYTTISAEMDDIIFRNNIVICQSQSNTGSQLSRPQAWAKNIVSVGGVNHRNTLDKGDDGWGGASIGPAADGRIKPDVTHFYDSIFTVSSSGDTAYTSSFGGTSGATPITAGHFGLIFQMWHEQVFPGFGGGNSVFDSKPAATTAKALMINTAEQYAFSGSSHNLSRDKQGWGMADLEYLYDHRDRLLIVDQAEQLSEFESRTYQVEVFPGSPELKVTMIFPDPQGNPSGQFARINDLSLKVTAPDSTVYWGNNNMRNANYTAPGGSANTVDTVENVFVQSPMGGQWTIEVIASDINEDGDLRSPEIDSTFSLVASGIGPIPLRLENSRFVSGVNCDMEVFAATPGQTVAFLYSVRGLGSTYIPQLDVTIDLAAPALAGSRTADANGYALLRRRVPPNTQGRRVWTQAAEFQRKSNVVEQVIE